MKNIYATDIAIYLGTKLQGSDFEIKQVSSLSNIANYSVTFSKKEVPAAALKLKSLILCDENQIIEDGHIASFIKIKNPKLAFAKVIEHFFKEEKKACIHHTAVIDSSSKIGENVSVGAYTVIGANVEIGKNTLINNHVVINNNTKINENCYIKSGAIIGEDGFGFDFEDDGTPIRIHHLGNVKIGNNVEIGANTIIARGTIDSTIIENNVKIDDNVFIAHNCHIQEKTVVIAFAEISGSVKIGKSCWIGPNSSIIQKVKIGNNAFIGIAANVTKDVEDGVTVAGNPAKVIKRSD